MTDWLSGGLDDSGAGSGDDFLGGSASYLDLDNPPAPDGAPAPPSAPAGYDGGDGYPGGDPYASGNGHDPYAADQGGAVAVAPPQDPVASYYSNDHLHAPAPMAQAPAPMAAPAMAAAPSGMGLSVEAPYLEELHTGQQVGGRRGMSSDISELVLDVEVQVEVSFGDAALTVEEFLEMGRGSVVELDHAIDAPIELRVKGRLVARGQLVTVNGNYGMRITEMTNEGRG